MSDTNPVCGQMFLFVVSLKADLYRAWKALEHNGKENWIGGSLCSTKTPNVQKPPVLFAGAELRPAQVLPAWLSWIQKCHIAWLLGRLQA